MASPVDGDPFALTDNASIDVPNGIFAAGDETLDRTGSTNARLVLGGPLARFRAAPSAARVSWLVAAVALLVVVVVIPVSIGSFAAVRKESLAASTDAPAQPAVVVLSAETLAVSAQVDAIEPAYVMSNGLVTDESKTTMGDMLTTARDQINVNDAAGAASTMESAVPYFVSEYSQRVATAAETEVEEYVQSEYETDERLAELIAIVRANAQGQDLTALVSAVIEIPQVVGDARAEHFGNRRTYVPPAPTTAAPAPTSSAATQPPATEAPQLTQAPAPSQTSAPEPSKEPDPEPKPTGGPNFTSAPNDD
ncbi:hypothetical protein C5E10_14770 [Pseudoclavibacter sp. RFBG4]|uniref:hypothetical protein n=1 Tax=Pseudoclavibacter sp. RFBG4 TaxID=2080575 RepID=UPI000CE7BC35|nr:hypothetical protein [Pseudoclavibacter sp. RFBG4]PPG27785.1 hypothetical protein C5E10_14770 [Pseudoclavibacter sp. RFBG4]